MAYTTIDDPSAYFKVQLYTGNGSADHAITFDDTDTDMQPDFVWIKPRSTATEHNVYDAPRGVTWALQTHNAEVQGENNGYGWLSAFGSDGFTVVEGGSNASRVNGDGVTYVAWCWKGGTTSGITTDGNTTITPSGYSFNQTAGFSVIKYTGNATSGAKLAHGLGATPEMVICKNLDSGNSWVVGHQGADTTAPWDYGMNLDSAAARSNTALFWNDTAPDSVNITLGSSDDNNEAAAHVAYCFNEVQGFSKFGSYTGNGNADGAFVYLGFRPAYILIKRADSTSNWSVYDNKRPGSYNLTTIGFLRADTTIAEQTNAQIQIMSNGIKIPTTETDLNADGGTYVYAAWAEQPFVNSNGVPCNAR